MSNMANRQTAPQMKIVHLRQTVRPTKFLFLVTSKDTAMIERVATMNTALWGGIFNPIVPVEYGNESVAKIFQSSHSDFLVNTIGDLDRGFLGKNFDRKLLQLEDWDGLVSKDSGQFVFRSGCDMLPLFRHYYREEGRHENLSKRSHRLVLLTGEDPNWRRYALFQSGLFPQSFKYDYEKAYIDSTLAERIVLNELVIPAIQFYHLWTPLSFTHSKVEFLFHSPWGWRDSHIVFIGNWQSHTDWLEFWNLRCFGSNILFVSQEHLRFFDNSIAEYFDAGNYPLNENDDKVRNCATIQKSSSLSSDEFDTAIKYIVERHKEHPKAIRDWLPKFGIKRTQRNGVVYGPPPLEAPIGRGMAEEDIAFIAEDEVEFRILKPTWLESHAPDDHHSWSVSVDFWGVRNDELCFKYPALPSVEEALLRHNLGARDFRLSPRESIVYHFGRKYSLETTSFYPMTTFALFRAIFEEFGLKIIELSEKGQYAARIEETMGGQYGGAGLLRDKGVRHLLAQLASDNPETNLPRQELERIIGMYSSLIRDPQKRMQPAEIVNALVARKALRPGLELKCQYCYKRGWYHISEFDEDFTCRYCFTKQPAQLYEFPEWRYRSSGLFATKDVGYGSLVVIATSLFFRWEILVEEIRCVYSFNIEGQNGACNEVDLAVLQLGLGGDYHMALCECKTSDFDESDFTKLMKLVEQIPNSVGCIATMKPEFTPQEREHASKFWARGYPLIMLTEKELESSDLPSEELLERIRYSPGILPIAEATRHLYLS